MMFSIISRREFASQSAAALALPAPTLAAGASAQPTETKRTLHVVCVGAHPDDPESGCGGTLARYAERGHRVTIIYLTRGEAGIRGKSHEEAAAIRTAEAEAACKILGAKPVFAGQIDGAAEVNPRRTEAFVALVLAERPDLLLTHWPIDTHPDHQAASFLTIRAGLASRGRVPLYFFEVDYGYQTMGFQPTDYVDITTVREKKKAALFAHRSQDGAAIYREHHEIMENFRGRESGVPAAEAFVSLPRNDVKRGLPGLD
jgi:LmbE family N-acetylglucosaminyl deacetylase